VCFDFLYNFYPKLLSFQGEYNDIINDQNINFHGNPSSGSRVKSETNKICDGQLMPDTFNKNEINRHVYAKGSSSNKYDNVA
jgi:hypothetical protein